MCGQHHPCFQNLPLLGHLQLSAAPLLLLLLLGLTNSSPQQPPQKGVSRHHHTSWIGNAWLLMIVIILSR